jgi:hypothetical protein
MSSPEFSSEWTNGPDTHSRADVPSVERLRFDQILGPTDNGSPISEQRQFQLRVRRSKQQQEGIRFHFT